MNKPSPLVSKSPFVSEQYTALWEAVTQCGKELTRFPNHRWTGDDEYDSAETFFSTVYQDRVITATVDMLNRLGYKIVKVQE